MTTGWLIFAGLATPPIASLIAVRLTLKARARSFIRAKALGKFPDYAKLELPAVELTPEALTLQSAYKAIAEVEHGEAKRLQDLCIGYVVAASAALFLAFLGTALGATLMTGVEAWRPFSDALDVSALAIVLSGFIRSQSLRLQWLRARIVAEAIRQWGVIEGIFVLTGTGFTTQIETFLDRTRRIVADNRDPLAAGQTLAETRGVEVTSMLAAPISAAQLRVYLLARPVQQARWFVRSIAGIESQQSHREHIMVSLFAVALLAALVKLLAPIILADEPKALGDFALLVLLLASGIAAAASSAYFGHNTRSVLHRYRAQERLLQLWFKLHGATIELARGQDLLTGEASIAAAKAVTGFEELMMNELVDWLAISTTDSMELGLS